MWPCLSSSWEASRSGKSSRHYIFVYTGLYRRVAVVVSLLRLCNSCYIVYDDKATKMQLVSTALCCPL